MSSSTALRPYLEQIDPNICPICTTRQSRHSSKLPLLYSKDHNHSIIDDHEKESVCEMCTTSLYPRSLEVLSLLSTLCISSKKVIQLDSIRESERVNGFLLNHSDTSETATERLCKLSENGLYYPKFESIFVLASTQNNHLVGELKTGTLFVLDVDEFDLTKIYTTEFHNPTINRYEIYPTSNLSTGMDKKTLLANTI